MDGWMERVRPSLCPTGFNAGQPHEAQQRAAGARRSLVTAVKHARGRRGQTRGTIGIQQALIPINWSQCYMLKTGAIIMSFFQLTCSRCQRSEAASCRCHNCKNLWPRWGDQSSGSCFLALGLLIPSDAVQWMVFFDIKRELRKENIGFFWALLFLQWLMEYGVCHILFELIPVRRLWLEFTV
jgi:hypothetical protein